MGKRGGTRVRKAFSPQCGEAVALVEEGKRVTEVARDLGISRSLLQYWPRISHWRHSSGRFDREGPNPGSYPLRIAEDSTAALRTRIDWIGRV